MCATAALVWKLVHKLVHASLHKEKWTLSQFFVRRFF